MENNIEFNKKSKLSIASEVLKYVVIGLYVAFTAFLVIVLISTYKQEIAVEEEMFDGLGFALAFVVFGMIFGIIGYLIIMIVSFIGLMISIKDKENRRRKLNNLCFILGMILPVITEILILVICRNVANKI